MRRLQIGFYCIATSCFLGGCATEEGGKSLLTRHANLTLMQAASIAEKSISDSHAIKAELTQAGNNVVYEVFILKRVFVDGQDGHIIPSDTKDANTPVVLELK